ACVVAGATVVWGAAVGAVVTRGRVGVVERRRGLREVLDVPTSTPGSSRRWPVDARSAASAKGTGARFASTGLYIAPNIRAGYEPPVTPRPPIRIGTLPCIAPIHTAVDSSRLKPTNQALEKSCAVPVLPPTSWPGTRAAVPVPPRTLSLR